MYFDTLDAALHMDGHGAYVWTAYAVSLFVLAIVLHRPFRRHRRFTREIIAEQRRANAAAERRTSNSNHPVKEAS